MYTIEVPFNLFYLGCEIADFALAQQQMYKVRQDGSQHASTAWHIPEIKKHAWYLS